MLYIIYKPITSIIQPGLILITQTRLLAVKRLVFSQEIPEYPVSSKHGIGYIINLFDLQLNNKNVTKIYKNVRHYILDRFYI